MSKIINIQDYKNKKAWATHDFEVVIFVLGYRMQIAGNYTQFHKELTNWELETMRCLGKQPETDAEWDRVIERAEYKIKQWFRFEGC